MSPRIAMAAVLPPGPMLVEVAPDVGLVRELGGGPGDSVLLSVAERARTARTEAAWKALEASSA